MIIHLYRHAYLDDCTRGTLHIQEHEFQTVERPWVPATGGPGGTPYESCIPDGTYRVRGFVRPSGRRVFILSNPQEGVWEQDSERQGVSWGRFLILIHAGNTADDVVGCIAPGMIGYDRAVGNSRAAMTKLLELLEGYEHELVIGPKGAR